MKINLIIPIFNLTGDRLRNFFFILEKILDAGLPVTVVEQESNNMLPSISIQINHVIVESKVPIIEKSKLINKGVESINNGSIWIHDADIMLPFKYAFQLINPKHKVTKPFVYFTRMSNGETIRYIADGSVVIPSIEMYGSDFGAASFIIDKNLFQEVGGMNERFKGWGYEDIEFGSRVMRISYPYILPIRALHLYHKPAFGINTSRENINAEIYRSSLTLKG